MLKVYKASLPGGTAFIGELNPPWRSKPVEWTEVASKTYETSEGGLDDYAAIGPMSPADRRYGGISIVLKDSPVAWVYASAEVYLSSDNQPDRLVEWDYRQLVATDPVTNGDVESASTSKAPTARKTRHRTE